MRISRTLFIAAKSMFLLLVAFAVAFPLFWITITSLKTDAEALAIPPTWLPKKWTVENYVYQFNPVSAESQDKGITETAQSVSLFMRYVMNDLIISFSVCFACIVLALLAGYGFSRFDFPGKKATLMFFLSTQMFPYVAIVVPIYIMYRSLRLLNTYTGLIFAILGMELPFSIWMLKGFCDTIPKDFEEAALIEGAGRIRVLFNIILPVTTPGIVSVGMFSFLASWSHLLYVMILGTDDRVKTVPAGMVAYLGNNLLRYWGDACSLLVIASLPIAVVFLSLQRQFVAGLTAGAVKG